MLQKPVPKFISLQLLCLSFFLILSCEQPQNKTHKKTIKKIEESTKESSSIKKENVIQEIDKSPETKKSISEIKSSFDRIPIEDQKEFYKAWNCQIKKEFEEFKKNNKPRTGLTADKINSVYKELKSGKININKCD